MNNRESGVEKMKKDGKSLTTDLLGLGPSQRN